MDPSRLLLSRTSGAVVDRRLHELSSSLNQKPGRIVFPDDDEWATT
jgi:hypothetical protein